VFVLRGRDPIPRERENARTTGAILTASTMKNTRLLEESAKRAKERHQAGYLTDEEHRGMEAVINKARAGDWSVPRRAATSFARSTPSLRKGIRGCATIMASRTGRLRVLSLVRVGFWRQLRDFASPASPSWSATWTPTIEGPASRPRQRTAMV
jgi:hypothetical protein